MNITENKTMMIKSDFHKYLPACYKKMVLKLLALFIISIGILNSCNYKERDFFVPLSALTNPNGGINLEAPILLNPSNGATGLDYMQTFEWDPVESASIYELQLAEDGQNFMQGMQFETNTNMFEYSDLKLQTDYSWRVRAGHEGIYSPWSNTWEFRTMDPQQLEAPQLISPENGATDVETPVQFSWSAVTDADFGYNFQLSTSNTFDELLVDEEIDDIVIEIEEEFIEPEIQNFWRVKAMGGVTFNEPVESDWSETSSFKTKAEDEDVTPPDLSLQKACVEHDEAVSFIKLLWEMNFLDTATAVNMIIRLKITGPGTDTTIEATPNQNLLFTHILQISSYGLYAYEISQILLNGEPVEFTGETTGEVDVESAEQNVGECDL